MTVVNFHDSPIYSKLRVERDMLYLNRNDVDSNLMNEKTAKVRQLIGPIIIKRLVFVLEYLQGNVAKVSIKHNITEI